MTPLPAAFKDRGFDFKQIDRQGEIALFSKTKGNNRSFEVVIVQKCPEHTWPNGNTSPAHEAMPSPETWGRCGFTYTTLESARNRLKTLMDKPDASVMAKSDSPPALGLIHKQRT